MSMSAEHTSHELTPSPCSGGQILNDCIRHDYHHYFNAKGGETVNRLTILCRRAEAIK